MSCVRIYAVYDDDENQKLIIFGFQDEKKHMNFNKNGQMFGYVEDWSDDENNYLKYPFILEAENDAESAVMNWGWNVPSSIIDIRGRRIVEGEKINRYDIDEKAIYTITSVFPIDC